MIRVRDLRVDYDTVCAVRDLSLNVGAGEVCGLIGPNGAGKTTLINLITGALQPDKGQILLGDNDITALDPDRRVKRGLARTFQINTLFPDLEPLEAVTLAICERQGVASVWWRRLAGFRDAVDEAYDILTSLRLADVGNRPTRELAYGQQRLLEIALALATRPKVLLLDEPAAGVPRQDSGELFEAIANLSSDITVLFIEHDMELVFRFASRVIVMVGGRLLLEGTPAEIAADPRVREVYLGQAHHG
jgi:ABC-type branched-subunit amino acid transport system ATPase component